MAKRRDMYEQLARRRTEKVPILTAQHVRDFHVRLIPVEDVREDGRVVKVVSRIYLHAQFAGLTDDFAVSAPVEVPLGAPAREELKGCLQGAFTTALDTLEDQYQAAMQDKLENQIPPVQQPAPEPEPPTETAPADPVTPEPEPEPEPDEDEEEKEPTPAPNAIPGFPSAKKGGGK